MNFHFCYLAVTIFVIKTRYVFCEELAGSKEKLDMTTEQDRYLAIF
jgi:hypothetical protein